MGSRGRRGEEGGHRRRDLREMEWRGEERKRRFSKKKKRKVGGISSE
jgi:hypothetical protein